jgi:uncharacterized protein YqeY
MTLLLCNRNPDNQVSDLTVIQYNKSMDTKQKLESALKDAMRAGDDTAKRTLRMALAAIRMAEMDKGSALDETSIMAILQKEIKSRNEAIQEAQRANRADLIAANQAEIKVLEQYLPKPLSGEELKQIAQAVISEVDAKTPADMGKVMKVLLPRLQGRAPGDQASQVVRQLLQSM